MLFLEMFEGSKYMGVSINGGTPKSSILIGFSLINHPFWGTLILGNPQILFKQKCLRQRHKPPSSIERSRCQYAARHRQRWANPLTELVLPSEMRGIVDLIKHEIMLVKQK